MLRGKGKISCLGRGANFSSTCSSRCFKQFFYFSADWKYFLLLKAALTPSKTTVSTTFRNHSAALNEGLCFGLDWLCESIWEAKKWRHCQKSFFAPAKVTFQLSKQAFQLKTFRLYFEGVNKVSRNIKMLLTVQIDDKTFQLMAPSVS